MKKQSTIDKNPQSGFTHLFLLMAAVTIVIISLVASRVVLKQNNKLNLQEAEDKSSHYSASIEVSGDRSYLQQAYLNVYFEDSISSDGGCPTRLGSFAGDVSITYKNEREANIKSISKYKT